MHGSSALEMWQVGVRNWIFNFVQLQINSHTYQMICCICRTERVVPQVTAGDSKLVCVHSFLYSQHLVQCSVNE